MPSTARHHSRGGLTPAALAECERLPVSYGLPSTARHHCHGGLTPAALVNQRSCIAQAAVSPGNLRTVEPPRAGGVSPPWRLETRMQRQSAHTVGGLPTNSGRVCGCDFAHPRRADARRSYLPLRRSPKDVRCSPHGVCIAYHGGLTPAAFVNESVCTAKIVVLPADGRCNSAKSGGRKPPVAPRNANARAIRTHTVGGLPTNSGRVCGCDFAHPRRADARRS